MTPAPRLPDKTRLYAIGDVHGRLDLLQDLHRMIAADAAELDPGVRRVVVYLGDYVDRGPDSRGVIELLLGEPLAGFEQVCLKGNHEQIMHDYLDGTGEASMWFSNGGDATASSYGVAVVQDDYRDKERTGTRGALNDAVPRMHMRFLRALRPFLILGDYMFVHAGIDFRRPLELQRESELLWIREPFLSSTDKFGAVVVHGHSISREPECRANRIGIDTGACYSGILTALALEGTERRFLQTAGDAVDTRN